MSGTLILLNRSKHDVPAGYLDTPITSPSSMATPFRPGQHLPPQLLEQIALCHDMARTPEEQDAIRRAATHKGVTDAQHGALLHLLYLRKSCATDNMLGRGIKQLADKLRRGQNVALTCRCVREIYRGERPTPENCHGVNLYHAISGYARR